MLTFAITAALGFVTSMPDPPKSVEERYEALDKEFAARRGAYVKALNEARADTEKEEVANRLRRLAPDNADYSRRFLALAKEEPSGPIASDALYYALQLQGHRLSPEGAEALARLRRDHLTSPKMALYIQQLSMRPWAEVEPLLHEVLARHPDRTAKGHACLGLAEMVARRATLPKLANDPATARGLEEVYGKERLDAVLRQDVATNIKEAAALHERVLSEFADVKYFPELPDDKSTLAPHAARWLAGQDELAIGKPAPEIEGKDVNGKAFKLSDHRGKVVAVVFWATWCVPCMDQISHERELVRKMAGRPFALLGVNCDHKPGEARAALAEERITWPNWYDGDLREGTIADLYHVQALPAVFVLDASGIIRERDVRGEALARAIEALLGEQEAKIAK